MNGRSSIGRTLVAAMLVTPALGVLSACGGDDAATEERIARAAEDGRRQARAEAKADKAAEEAKRLQKQLDDLRKDNRSGGSSSGGVSASSSSSNNGPGASGGSCGSGISVNSQTSCPFAQNVRDAFYASGRDSVIEVFSPVTNQAYTMTCTSSSPYTCRGGNNAQVTFP